MSQASSRNNNIGILHMAGALFVMYGHQCNLLGRYVPILFGDGMHAIGVRLIFILTGYLITKSLCSIKGSRPRVMGVYAVKRLSRIYPELLGCLCITALVVGPIFTALPLGEYFSGDNGTMVFEYIFSNLRMSVYYFLPGVFMDSPVIKGSVNGPLWTLPVELAMYVVILLLIISVKNKTIQRIIFATITLLVIGLTLWRIQFGMDFHLVYYGTDWCEALVGAPFFLVGGLASLLPIDKYLHPELSAILVLAFVGVVFTVPALNYLSDLVFLSYFVLSVGFSSRQTPIILKHIRCEYAYGMYLYGFVVQQCVIQVFQRNGWTLSVNLCFVISIVITYILAMLSYKLFYLPVKKLMGKMHI